MGVRPPLQRGIAHCFALHCCLAYCCGCIAALLLRVALLHCILLRVAALQRATVQRCIVARCSAAQRILRVAVIMLRMLIVALSRCRRLHVARFMAQARCARAMLHTAVCAVACDTRRRGMLCTHCTSRAGAMLVACCALTARRAPAQCSALPSAQRNAPPPIGISTTVK
jgi:hypothetical protein